MSVSPTSFSEAAGSNAAIGTVTRTGSTTNALTVTLASNDTTEATVPTTVEISAIVVIPIRQKNATDRPSCRDAIHRVFIQGCVAIIN
ncbi:MULTISPECIES: hypothetical protein [Fischerella]|uniref:hypothetical protein n=1 Tax=Fischerella TaxID=1190 RepID=UPI0002D7BD87|nr:MULTISPECIES: hypothetical protein [Fischerella]